MTKIKSKKKIKRRKVTFTLVSSDAKEVILMGDFNNWNLKTHHMKKDGNGIWNKVVTLPLGSYDYKFLVDGQWKEDPQNGQTRVNCFGTYNSVLDLRK